MPPPKSSKAEKQNKNIKKKSIFKNSKPKRTGRISGPIYFKNAQSQKKFKKGGKVLTWDQLSPRRQKRFQELASRESDLRAYISEERVSAEDLADDEPLPEEFQICCFADQ